MDKESEKASGAGTVELSLVIPVYNGEETIESTLKIWKEILKPVGGEIIVVNDGSINGTKEILNRLATRTFDNLNVIHQMNAGHGPAIRRGYEIARGKWIFQADSDNEIEPRHFNALWDRRRDGDIVLAERRGRVFGPVRRLLTFGEELLTMLFGKRRIPDPNVPFRLIRSDRLKEFCQGVKPDEFAPNLLMTLWGLRRGWRIVVVKLPHNPHHRSPRSLQGRKLLQGCLSAFTGIVKLFFNPSAKRSS